MIVIDKMRTFRIGNGGREEIAKKKEHLIQTRIKELHEKFANERARAIEGYRHNIERVRRVRADLKKTLPVLRPLDKEARPTDKEMKK